MNKANNRHKQQAKRVNTTRMESISEQQQQQNKSKMKNENRNDGILVWRETHTHGERSAIDIEFFKQKLRTRLILLFVATRGEYVSAQRSTHTNNKSLPPIRLFLTYGSALAKMIFLIRFSVLYKRFITRKSTVWSKSKSAIGF